MVDQVYEAFIQRDRVVLHLVIVLGSELLKELLEWLGRLDVELKLLIMDADDLTDSLLVLLDWDELLFRHLQVRVINQICD